jgi:hypothetical protein
VSVRDDSPDDSQEGPHRHATADALDTRSKPRCQTQPYAATSSPRSASSSDRVSRILDEIRAVPEQLHPERARSCRNAITMCSVMIDEIRLRAHAQPLDEAQGDIAN